MEYARKKSIEMACQTDSRLKFGQCWPSSETGNIFEFLSDSSAWRWKTWCKPFGHFFSIRNFHSHSGQPFQHMRLLTCFKFWKIKCSTTKETGPKYDASRKFLAAARPPGNTERKGKVVSEKKRICCSLSVQWKTRFPHKTFLKKK